ncbi:MAG: protein-export chaperone SecB [Muribaculaceae bacterium]|nr:protein-export chaperone SecB [Muribaculaceae bacterium]
MEQAKNANFRFVSYLIKDLSLSLKDFVSTDEISLNLELNATVPSNGEDLQPQLEIVVDMQDKVGDFSLKMRIVGSFEADENVESQQLNAFIALNAPAILFPYIRAFISSITAQAGIQPIIIPTVNLYGLGQELLSSMNANKQTSGSCSKI